MTTLGSMFSGAGLLDLGLERTGLRTIWQVEVDPQASKVLARHWPGVPNLGNVTQVDWSAVERPDVLCGGGWPCQPFSSAGRQLGEADPRYMWPEVARALRELRPRVFVMEQSPALLARRFRPVWLRALADLADLGFDAEWTVLRASDVGAPHRRRRLFLVAHTQCDGRGTGSRGRDGTILGARVRGDAARGRPAVADAGGAPGRSLPGGAPGHEGVDAGGGPDGTDLARGGGEAAADSLRPRREAAGSPEPSGRSLARWGPYAPAIARWEHLIGERAPDPLDDRGRLNVELTRWMMGAPPGWCNGLSRTAAIRCYGNGVVVQVAETVGRGLLDGETPVDEAQREEENDG